MRQIFATQYINSSDIDFFECVIDHIGSVNKIKTKYQLLKFVNTLEKKYKGGNR